MGHTLNAKNDYLRRMARVQVPKSSLTEPLGVQESIIQYLHKVKQNQIFGVGFLFMLQNPSVVKTYFT